MKILNEATSINSLSMNNTNIHYIIEILKSESFKQFIRETIVPYYSDYSLYQLAKDICLACNELLMHSSPFTAYLSDNTDNMLSINYNNEIDIVIDLKNTNTEFKYEKPIIGVTDNFRKIQDFIEKTYKERLYLGE